MAEGIDSSTTYFLHCKNCHNYAMLVTFSESSLTIICLECDSEVFDIPKDKLEGFLKAATILGCQDPAHHHEN